MLLSVSNVELRPNMLLCLSQYGLTLNDIHLESAIPNLAGTHASYTMNALSTISRVWLDRLEIAFLDLFRVTEEQIIEITEATLEALRQTVSDMSAETYTATLATHGTFQDVSLP